MRPAAVIVGASGAEASADALERQTVAPGEVLKLRSAGELDDALRTASRADPSWVWLLDGGIAPEPTALERLLDAADNQLALISSKVTRPDGNLERASLPVPEVHRGELVLEALDRHHVPLRVARRGSLLVRFDALKASGASAAFERDLAWSARLLSRSAGALEPRSVVVRTRGAERGWPSVSETVGLLGALAPRDRPWFLAHCVEQALEARR